MPRSLEIEAGWETLVGGSDEELACFASIAIKAGGRWLTEGRDAISNSLRTSPRLSAYHLAEWLVWNWWRLRWEPRVGSGDSRDWLLAHRMSNIGGGYIWPNVTIFSDGERIAFLSKPTLERPGTAYRYISDVAAVIPSRDFESEVDSFVGQVLERLKVSNLRDSNLARLWEDLITERNIPTLALGRKLEALLSRDPDESNDALVEKLIDEADLLSIAGVEELAADAGNKHGNAVLSAADLKKAVSSSGFEISFRDRVKAPLIAVGDRARGAMAAGLRGAELARALRTQENLGHQPLTEKRLAELAGAPETVMTSQPKERLDLSFSLNESSGDKAGIFLRSKWQTGRRFELARLLGDLLLNPDGALHPATKAQTYRQKAQKAFAAELLSPFNAVLGMLGSDFSSENQEEVAEYFGVSPLTIRTLLVNNHILPREDMDSDLFPVAA